MRAGFRRPGPLFLYMLGVCDGIYFRYIQVFLLYPDIFVIVCRIVIFALISFDYPIDFRYLRNSLT